MFISMAVLHNLQVVYTTKCNFFEYILGIKCTPDFRERVSSIYIKQKKNQVPEHPFEEKHHDCFCVLFHFCRI
ncbi:hypothetical protein KPH14_004508 [Odynerus spinipes]|uniref:Uncharacterized protein n=1 Tax=Odynerus spinipes TaxID=1348599 RepID=A0AAD9RM00_9HYME|nr:hypothetical protein KPH14_004508 [Odynerus spinipes]